MCYCFYHRVEHGFGEVLILDKGMCECGNPFIIKECAVSGVTWTEHMGEIAFELEEYTEDED